MKKENNILVKQGLVYNAVDRAPVVCDILVKEYETIISQKIQEKVDVLEEISNNNEIVLYNDDVNTFDHVIDTLIRVCEHTNEQAEQCAILVHYKGRCTVKTGSYDELKPQCSSLLDAGLSAEIE